MALEPRTEQEAEDQLAAALALSLVITAPPLEGPPHGGSRAAARGRVAYRPAPRAQAPEAQRHQPADGWELVSEEPPQAAPAGDRRPPPLRAVTARWLADNAARRKAK